MGVQSSKPQSIDNNPGPTGEAKKNPENVDSLYGAILSEISQNEQNLTDSSELVPCVFTWSHGGQNVYVTGSFNNWSVDKKIKLIRSTHDFSVICDLPRGTHQFKFIVDDNWKYAPEQATQSDANGNINNVLDITHYKKYAYRVPSDQEHARSAQYSQRIPRLNEYNADAPALPYMLSKSVSSFDAVSNKNISIPRHCTAAHTYHDLYAHSIFGPTVSVISECQRYRPPLPSYSTNRYGTTIFIAPNPLCPVIHPAFLGDDTNKEQWNPITRMKEDFSNCLSYMMETFECHEGEMGEERRGENRREDGVSVAPAIGQEDLLLSNISEIVQDISSKPNGLDLENITTND